MMSNRIGGLEARMVRRQLKEVCEMANELYCALDDHDDIHEWVQVKMATIHDRLHSVHSYLMYELEHPRADGLFAKLAEIQYRGHTFPGYNQPIQNRGTSQHKRMVLAKKGDKVKLVRFGHKGYGHNISPERKKNYLTRSAGIRNKSGELTKNDKFSANYWSRRVLWPRNKPANTEK